MINSTVDTGIRMPFESKKDDGWRIRKWNIPLTYAPKISGVLDGTIFQTIRTGRKFHVGDLVAFHGWEGKPYRSKWSFRTGYFPLVKVIDVTLNKKHGIIQSDGYCHRWEYDTLDELARQDGIEPPTGSALRDVIFNLNSNSKQNEVAAQIIRWITDVQEVDGNAGA